MIFPMEKKYRVAFTQRWIDLTQLSLADGDMEVTIETRFGGTVVELAPDSPFVVEAKAIFAESRMPDDRVSILGHVMYRSESARAARHILTLRCETVFGSLRFCIRTRELNATGG